MKRPTALALAGLVILVGLSIPVGATSHAEPPSDGESETRSTACSTTGPTTRVIGLRGSGETHSFGRTVGDVVERLRRMRPSVMTTYVDYKAVGVPTPKVFWRFATYRGDYRESVEHGRQQLRKTIRAVLKACPQTRLLLVGFSQGAHAVGDVIQDELTAAELKQVAAVALIGDPRFRGGSGSPPNVGSFNPSKNGVWDVTKSPRQLSSAEGKKVRSYCIKGDPVCNFTPGNLEGCIVHAGTCIHSDYLTSKYHGDRYTELAAEWLADHVAVPIATPGTFQRIASLGDNTFPPASFSAMSADGRFVSFAAGTTVNVWDRTTGQSVPVGNGNGPTISADGRFVVYVGWDPGSSGGELRVWDRMSETVVDSISVPGPTGNISHPDISADGSVVSYLLELNGTGSDWVNEVYRWDRSTEVPVKLSGSPAFYTEPSISGDGNHVAYEKPNPGGNERVCIWDKGQGTPCFLPGDTSGFPVLSHDGRYVGMNSEIRDRATNSTVHVDGGYYGSSNRGGIGGDGRFYAVPKAGKFVQGKWSLDMWLWDRATSSSLKLVDGNLSWDAQVSTNGKFVSFVSSANGLVPGDDDDSVDIFLWTRN